MTTTGLAAPSGTAPSAGADADDAWSRQARWWHLAFAASVGVTVLVGLSSGAQSGPLLSGAAVLVAAYLALGRHALDQTRERMGGAYLAVAWALMMLANLRVQGSWTLCFILFAQTWAMLRVRTAALVTVVVCATLAVTDLAAEGWDLGRAGPDLALTATGLLFAMAMGLFVNWLFDQVQERAAMIDELRRTQALVAASERSEGAYAERERLSGEIHDTLAQGFLSVVTHTRATRSALERGDVPLALQRLTTIEATALDNLAEARLMVAELVPAHLGSGGLGDALARLARTVGAESGLEVRLDVAADLARPLDPAVGVVVFRAAQEALTNARRHAHAQRVDVLLTDDGPGLVLRVTDDGVGLPAAPVSGFGLDLLRERAACVGGRASVCVGPGGGTVVEVRVPR